MKVRALDSWAGTRRRIARAARGLLYGLLDRLPATRRIEILRQLAFSVRRDLAVQIANLTGGVVQAGLFSGSKLSVDDLSESERNFVPKICGFYETELAEILAGVARERYSAIINIGCADGFYAIGLARINENAIVYASDTSPAAQVRCRKAAAANGLAHRLKIIGQLQPEDLETMLDQFDRCFIVSDCEGSEKLLLDPIKVPALAKADLLVECHDFLDPEITRTLTTRLTPTHVIQIIGEGGRDPNLTRLLDSQESLIRWLGVCEFRPAPMQWLYAVARARTLSGSSSLAEERFGDPQ